MLWLRMLIFVTLFVGSVLVLIPRWIVAANGPLELATGPARYVAALLIVVGAALMVWCWYEFVTRGRGTPAPIDPPRHLVVVGPYRYIRNPMYVAGLLVLLGQALLYSSRSLLVYAASYAVLTQAFVVFYEERTLARRFGDDYAAYRAAVGRWFPRRLRPYEPHAHAG